MANEAILRSILDAMAAFIGDDLALDTVRAMREEVDHTTAATRFGDATRQAEARRAARMVSLSVFGPVERRLARNVEPAPIAVPRPRVAA
jgi:hypothetical protein